MPKADLSNVLTKAGGSTRRKPAKPEEAAKPAAKSAATVPITFHFPVAVRSQLKVIAAEQNRTMLSLAAEMMNDFFAKYKKAEIAPTNEGE
jgi:hypothetical protein